MKYLVLLGDGMADFPLAECGGKTPLAAAHTPAMDEAARNGLSGLFCPIPDGYPAGSDIGNLSVFGYDPAETFTGRAPLEAANQGIDLAPDQLAFRCNLVTLADGALADFTAGHITSEEAAQLIEALNEALSGDAFRFVPGVSYRHLGIVTVAADLYESLVDLQCTPPHDIIDEQYTPYLPHGSARDVVLRIMDRSQDVLSRHPVNLARVKSGKLPATSLWLWGQGGAPRMATYAERFGLTGAVVSAVDLVNGIGRCAGFEVLRVPGVTGYLDTNYEGKAQAALEAFERVDFVYLHVEAPDEAAHEGRPDLKVQAIEDFDRRVVAPCLEHAKARTDCRVLIAPDHVTAISTRTHAGGPVPFALYGPGVVPNGVGGFSEEEAARAGVLYPEGHTLVPSMVNEGEIAFPPVS